MSLLHSFYCWGAVGGDFVLNPLFRGLRHGNLEDPHPDLAAVPLLNTFNFISCPIERTVEAGESMRPGQLFRLPLFWLLVLVMACAGAAEASMAQWASAFTESAMGVSKAVGDLAGPCLFAALMGISRILYGKMSGKLDLNKAMIACGILCAACYLTASLADLPAVGLTGCAAVRLLGRYHVAGHDQHCSRKCPNGGTAMFAFLALAGDLGATVGPAMVGGLSGTAGGNLQTGLLAASAFPLLLIFGTILLNRKPGGQKK